VIAVDAGCFIALADRRDRWHASAVNSLPTQREGWVTTWPVLAEACHVISRRLGVAVSAALMDDFGDGNLLVWSPGQAMLTRIPVLLRQCAELPMDLADASLVLLAEHLGHGRILSTDQRDFGAYRWTNHDPFHNLLEDPP
jgi:predicted nucleic acid-binding protein